MNRVWKKKALIIGGSGGLSGTLAAMAESTYDVWALTRGQRPLRDGITPLCADRDDNQAFQQAIEGAGVRFDVVFDCICMNEQHAKKDLEILSKVTNRLVVISTDSVYDPAAKQTPQGEEGIFIEENGTPSTCTYAGNKRKMEHVFLKSMDSVESNMKITIFRPGHIYGPGFLLGCFPEHSREAKLPELILAGTPICLVGNGIYLTHPIYVSDLACTMLDCVENHNTFQQIFCIGGPEAVKNRTYYELLGELLGVPTQIHELPLTGYLDSHPEYSGHLCHRIYDLSKLQSTGVVMPSTSLKNGLQMHLKALGFSRNI